MLDIGDTHVRYLSVFALLTIYISAATLLTMRINYLCGRAGSSLPKEELFPLSISKNLNWMKLVFLTPAFSWRDWIATVLIYLTRILFVLGLLGILAVAPSYH